MKKFGYVTVKSINILITAVLALLCFLVGYIFYCNIVQMPVPKLGPYSLYIVLSDSMNPVFFQGDAIVIKEQRPEALSKGDIIAFNVPFSDTVVTHRITEVSQTGDGCDFTTKGDANSINDNFMVPDDSVLGKYQFRMQGFGTVLNMVQSKPVLLVFPVLMVALIEYLLGRAENALKPKNKPSDDPGKENIEEIAGK